MNRGERQLLLSEVSALEDLLKRASPGDVLGKRSLESRLASVKAELQQMPSDSRMREEKHATAPSTMEMIHTSYMAHFCGFFSGRTCGTGTGTGTRRQKA